MGIGLFWNRQRKRSIDSSNGRDYTDPVIQGAKKEAVGDIIRKAN